jgi:RimJ/RimL family protein N-acetyltransferase
MLEVVASWIQDKDLGPLMGGLSVADPFNVIVHGLDATYDGQKNIMVGVFDDEKNVLGGAYFIHQEPRHRRAEVHHVFIKEYRGKFCLEAYNKIIDYMKNQLRIEMLYGMFATSNQHPSSYLMKLGWKKAGVLPKYFINSHGQEDSHVYYLELKCQ